MGLIVINLHMYWKSMNACEMYNGLFIEYAMCGSDVIILNRLSALRLETQRGLDMSMRGEIEIV